MGCASARHACSEKKNRRKKWYLKSPSSSLYVGENVDKQTVTKPADAGLFFFAKRTCVSSAVVADQTVALTDDSNVEEVATSEALSESDGSGTESQSGESESDVCSTACQNEDEATLDLEAETDGAAVSDTITQSIRGYVDVVRAALSGRSQSLSDTEKGFVIENKKPSEQTVLPSREYPESRRKSGTSTRSLLLKWFDRYDWPPLH